LSSSKFKRFANGEYISWEAYDLFFLAGVFGTNFFFFLADCILLENPYSGTDR